MTAALGPGSRPRVVSSDQAPSAITSLAHMKAVGGLGESSN